MIPAPPLASRVPAQLGGAPADTGRRTLLRRAALAATLAPGLWLVGCGFRPRGSGQPLVFQTLRLNGPAGSLIVQGLKGQLQASGVRVFDASVPVTEGEGARPDVVLDVLAERRERVVVGSTATGQVRELELRQRLLFRVRTPAGKELVAAQDLLQERELSFSETEVLSKATEEELLFRDMQLSMVRQIMARLAALRAL